MGQMMSVLPKNPSEGHPVSFGERLAGSARFAVLFDEGMALVNSAASYLDGAGRMDAKRLDQTAALAYAVESMRLTTRLIQVASWLLLQRAVNQGELTRVEAAIEQKRIRLDKDEKVSPDDVLGLLPLRLCRLIETSLRFQARLIHLDGQIYRGTGRRARPFAGRSPVSSQIAAIEAAFTFSRSAAAITSCRDRDCRTAS
jgi:regulator of CtrA degradation